MATRTRKLSYYGGATILIGLLNSLVIPALAGNLLFILFYQGALTMVMYATSDKALEGRKRLLGNKARKL